MYPHCGPNFLHQTPDQWLTMIKPAKTEPDPVDPDPGCPPSFSCSCADSSPGVILET